MTATKTYLRGTLITAGIAAMMALSACGDKPAASKEKAAAESGEAGHGHAEGEGHGKEEAGESTKMTDEAAKTAGVEIATAGPVSIDDTTSISGRVEIAPEGKGEVRAWYPGRIMSLSAQIGQNVSKGQTLARVESSESLQTYSIPAGISGVIMEKNANVGDTAYDRPIYVIANPNALQASFFLFPRDAESVRAGQSVSIKTLGGQTINATVSSLLSSVDPQTQTQTAIVKLPASAAGDLRAGMAIEGKFVTSQTVAAVAVPTDALQTLEGKQVVFVKSGTTYTARPVQVGRQTQAWAEIVDGLTAGESYVSKGSFLIRADIEKSGAEHEH